MRKLRTILIGAVVAFLCILEASAQEKVKIKVIKETETGREVFEKTYENEDEMRADPEYQEFFGADDPMIFSFSGSGNHSGIYMKQFSEDIERVMEDMRDIHIEFDDEDFDRFRVQIQRGTKEIEKHLKKLEEQLDEIDREDIDAELEKLKESLERNKIISPDRPEAFSMASLSDVSGNEFGKRGIVKDAERLQLNDLRTVLNTSAGLLELRFTVPEQDKLSVKILDEELDQQFSQTYSSFGGIYREKIRLESLKDGSYLLEIVSGDRRLTKKLELAK